ncbi:hypothetical protein BDV06DRAFT_192549 [Aspergillus oleicola]
MIEFEFHFVFFIGAKKLLILLIISAEAFAALYHRRKVLHQRTVDFTHKSGQKAELREVSRIEQNREKRTRQLNQVKTLMLTEPSVYYDCSAFLAQALAAFSGQS